MRALAFGVVLAVLLAPAAKAQTVGEMMQRCASVEGSGAVDADGLFCLGTANGIAQVLAMGCATTVFGGGESIPPQFTAAEPPSPAAAVQAFLTQARRAPERWREHHSMLFIHALSEAFPCPSQS